MHKNDKILRKIRSTLLLVGTGLKSTSAKPHINRHITITGQQEVHRSMFPHCAITEFPIFTFTFTFTSIDY